MSRTESTGMDGHAGKLILGPNDTILVTGATGFIGRRLVALLITKGFRNIRCLVRSTARAEQVLPLLHQQREEQSLEIVPGNLLSAEDCATAAQGAAVIFHLAAARGEKSFADAYMNSVVTTRNLLDAALSNRSLRRFVNVSSFTVYSNEQNGVLDESCPVETQPASRSDPYCFAKSKQEEMVREYGEKHGLPYVIVRPGHVYGPGNEAITGRVGVGTFGLFLHLGGRNCIPLTYVDNCADAIVLAGITKLNGRWEIFNVVDDDLPRSKDLLRQYKRNVKEFRSIYIPHSLSFLLCNLWERYSMWSQGQLEPVFNRKRWVATWKKTKYSNDKLKTQLGWSPSISTAEGLSRYFASCRRSERHA